MLGKKINTLELKNEFKAIGKDCYSLKAYEKMIEIFNVDIFDSLIEVDAWTLWVDFAEWNYSGLIDHYEEIYETALDKVKEIKGFTKEDKLETFTETYKDDITKEFIEKLSLIVDVYSLDNNNEKFLIRTTG